MKYMNQNKIPNTIKNPCAVCSGYDSMQRGIGKRCWGFRAGNWIYCSRDDYAGWGFGKNGAPRTDSGLYKHYLAGTCVCGDQHWINLGGDHNNDSWIASDSGFNYQTVDMERKKLHFQKIWDESVPIKNTLAEKYLKSRAITISSDELRFHPEISHRSTREVHPTMIAANRLFTTKEIIGIQRTYLTKDGEKLQTNIGYQISNKMALGKIKGGAVWLRPPTEELGVAEGIETALSVIQALDTPVCASLGVGFMRAIKLPPLPLAKKIKIFADGDSGAYYTVAKAGDYWVDEGREVIYCPAPHGKDFNDVLQEISHE